MIPDRHSDHHDPEPDDERYFAMLDTRRDGLPSLPLDPDARAMIEHMFAALPAGEKS